MEQVLGAAGPLRLFNESLEQDLPNGSDGGTGGRAGLCHGSSLGSAGIGSTDNPATIAEPFGDRPARTGTRQPPSERVLPHGPDGVFSRMVPHGPDGTRTHGPDSSSVLVRPAWVPAGRAPRALGAEGSAFSALALLLPPLADAGKVRPAV